MSDRSYFQLRIYDVPADITDEQRGAVEDLFADHYLNRESDVEDGTLTDLWTTDEDLLDTYQTVAAALIDINPGFTFACWNDPKYEWMGGLSMYAPDLGLWQGDCDTHGNPVFTTREILNILKGGSAFGAEQDKAFGVPWIDRLEKLEGN